MGLKRVGEVSSAVSHETTQSNYTKQQQKTEARCWRAAWRGDVVVGGKREGGEEMGREGGVARLHSLSNRNGD